MKTSSSNKDIQSTSKLNARLNANQHASRDFDEWCFRQFPEIPIPARILDLGCGTGKQIQLFSPVFSNKTTFVGIDTSARSLEELRNSYQHSAQLQLIEGSFDEMENFTQLKDRSFDLIYASYALYYTHNLEKLIRDIYRLLKPGGILWVITPYMGTNDEFLRIIRPLHEVEPFMDYVFDEFHREVVAKAEETGFTSLKLSMLRNKVPFANGEAFLTYLSNSLFYRAGHDEEIVRQVNEVCRDEGNFQVSKNIVSIQLRKG